MTQDAEDVQPTVVSEETTALGGDKPPEEQPLTEAKIKEIIGEATKEAKREIQSVKDKARAEIEAAQVRARLAEETLAGIEGLDPDATEVAKLRARDKHYQAREAQAYQRQQMDVFAKNFRANMNQFITEMGIDPNDKGIDWGDDARDYLTKQQRILASVGKLQKESAETLKQRVKQEAEDRVAKERREAGIDSVDTSASMGAGKSIPTDKEALGKWVANLSTEEYEKLKPNIDKMMAEGKIK